MRGAPAGAGRGGRAPPRRGGEGGQTSGLVLAPPGVAPVYARPRVSANGRRRWWQRAALRPRIGRRARQWAERHPVRRQRRSVCRCGAAMTAHSFALPLVFFSAFWGLVGIAAPWFVPKGPNRG